MHWSVDTMYCTYSSPPPPPKKKSLFGPLTSPLGSPKSDFAFKDLFGVFETTFNSFETVPCKYASDCFFYWCL